MKDPRQISDPMFKVFRVLLIVCGILLVVMVALLYMSRQSHAKPTEQEPVVATPDQPEVPAEFVQEAPQPEKELPVLDAATNAAESTNSLRQLDATEQALAQFGLSSDVAETAKIVTVPRVKTPVSQ